MVSLTLDMFGGPLGALLAIVLVVVGAVVIASIKTSGDRSEDHTGGLLFWRKSKKDEEKKGDDKDYLNRDERKSGRDSRDSESDRTREGEENRRLLRENEELKRQLEQNTQKPKQFNSDETDGNKAKVKKKGERTKDADEGKQPESRLEPRPTNQPENRQLTPQQRAFLGLPRSERVKLWRQGLPADVQQTYAHALATDPDGPLAKEAMESFEEFYREKSGGSKSNPQVRREAQNALTDQIQWETTLSFHRAVRALRDMLNKNQVAGQRLLYCLTQQPPDLRGREAELALLQQELGDQVTLDLNDPNALLVLHEAATDIELRGGNRNRYRAVVETLGEMRRNESDQERKLREVIRNNPDASVVELFQPLQAVMMRLRNRDITLPGADILAIAKDVYLTELRVEQQQTQPTAEPAQSEEQPAEQPEATPAEDGETMVVEHTETRVIETTVEGEPDATLPATDPANPPAGGEEPNQKKGNENSEPGA